MSQTRRRRIARALAVMLAAILAITDGGGRRAALGTDAVDATGAQPIAISLDRTTCAGTASGESWPRDTSRIIIPFGKECPFPGVWLRWDDDHGAEAGHDAASLVDWILHPDSNDLSEPGWQRALPGLSRARLREAETALNTWADKVILLPLFDRTRGSGDRSEVHVDAVMPFRLHRAYLASGDPACEADPLETCLVGSLVQEPPSPSPTPSASPSPTPSPHAVLTLDVPRAIAIPLLRGQANRVDIPVRITGAGPWSVCVEDTTIGEDRGRMVSADLVHTLSSPMSAGLAQQELVPLDRPTCVRLLTGANDASALVMLEQEVGPSDRPGPYRIGLIFRLISGF